MRGERARGRSEDQVTERMQRYLFERLSRSLPPSASAAELQASRRLFCTFIHKRTDNFFDTSMRFLVADVDISQIHR